MTDHATHDAPAADAPFSAAEIREFDADDVDAGKNICKMLSLFFLYTVFVMGFATYVTYSWLMN